MSNDNINKELERAVKGNHFEEVKALLSAGADANLRVEWNRDTLLHITRSVEITKELLLRGADGNAINQYRETPLHSAVTLGRELEIVKELLKHGAYVNATNRKGNTALNHAVKQNSPNLEIIKELLKHGADINIRNRETRCFDNHNTSLDNAVGDLTCAKLLIKFTLIQKFREDYKKIIDLDPYTECKNYSELLSYLEDCVCEIIQMKTDCLPLYEIVTNNFNKQKVCSNALSVALAKIDYSVPYPIYNDIILDKIKPFVERVGFLNKLSKIQIYTNIEMVNEDVKTKKIFLDYDSTYNITEYLSNGDLLNLLEAFDDFNKCDTQSLSSLNNLIEPDARLYETSASNNAKRARLE